VSLAPGIRLGPYEVPTRDGRSIAYLEARREGDIWLADFGDASGSQA